MSQMKIQLQLKHSTKQSLLFQLEQLASLLLCDDISFFSKEAQQSASDEIDALVLVLLNLSVKSSEAFAVNGIDDLILEISLKDQEKLVNLLNKNKYLLVEQENKALLILSMTKEQKQQLAKSNREMCKKLQELPIVRCGKPSVTNIQNQLQGCAKITKQAKEQLVDLKRLKAEPLDASVVEVELPLENAEQFVDETTFEFEIDSYKSTKDMHGYRQSSQFFCNKMPWFLVILFGKDEDNNPEIRLSLYCGYASEEFKNYSVSTNIELLLLSRVDAVPDKYEECEHVFKILGEQDDSIHGVSLSNFLSPDDLIETSPYVKLGKIVVSLHLKVGRLQR